MEQSEPLDEKSFADKYIFDNYVHVMVINPNTEDYKFTMMVETGIDRSTAKTRIEKRTFLVKAASKESYVGSVANLFLEGITKQTMQQDKTFSQYNDFNARAKYYDKFIVAVDDPFNDSSFVPYPDDLATKQAVVPVQEQPFAQIEADNGRLAKENEELRALLAIKDDEAAATKEPVPETKEEQPFAGMAGAAKPKAAKVGA